jgi:23S rRNA (cytosine1962-C5)-methyltransferase
MASTKTVTITMRGAARLRAGHLWVYAADIVDAGGAHGGEVVAVTETRGRPLGWALYSDRSQIALRWIAEPDVEIGRAFWRDRLLGAAAFRQQIAGGREAYRLVFAESDLLPSLIVDRYGDCFVLQTLSQGMEALKPLWVELLVELFAPRTILERNDAKVRTLEGLPLTKGVLYGATPEPVEITVGEKRFRVDLLQGQKTGAFLDQQENYQAVARYARGRILDGFCYAGGFALHLADRAESVLAADISPEAVEQARHNAEINAATNVTVVAANMFDLLRELDRQHERFDLIVLDPPAFAKSRAALPGALRGYKEINLRALRLLRPGGILVTCSCSYHMSEEMFLEVLREAAADAHRSVRVLERRTQAADHPILLAMPETHYLKCVIVQLL